MRRKPAKKVAKKVTKKSARKATKKVARKSAESGLPRTVSSRELNEPPFSIALATSSGLTPAAAASTSGGTA